MVVLLLNMLETVPLLGEGTATSHGTDKVVQGEVLVDMGLEGVVPRKDLRAQVTWPLPLPRSLRFGGLVDGSEI